MSIEHLLSLAPSRPQSTTDWESRFLLTERELSVSLPRSYKSLVAAYGPGSFGGVLWPFLPNDLVSQVPAVCDANREYERMAGRKLGFTFHPEPGGLWPWAVSDTGDYLYWIPERGTVAAHAVRAGEIREYHADIVGFLVGCLTGEVVTPVLGREFAELGRRHVPE